MQCVKTVQIIASARTVNMFSTPFWRRKFCGIISVAVISGKRPENAVHLPRTCTVGYLGVSDPGGCACRICEIVGWGHSHAVVLILARRICQTCTYFIVIRLPRTNASSKAFSACAVQPLQRIDAAIFAHCLPSCCFLHTESLSSWPAGVSSSSAGGAGYVHDIITAPLFSCDEPFSPGENLLQNVMTICSISSYSVWKYLSEQLSSA